MGTTNVKAAVFDERGKTLSLASKGVHVHFPVAGSAVQHLSELYKATIDAARNAVKRSRVDEVGAMVLGAQMHGLAAIDREGNELLPLVTYLDTRPAVALQRLNDMVDPYELYEDTGCPPLFIYPLTKFIWLDLTSPGILEKARWFVSAKDYIVFKMLGEPYVDKSVVSGSQLLNIRDLTWSDLALSLAGIGEERLPRLCDGERVLCALPNRMARQFGLSKSAPLILGASDAALHSLGVGAVKEGLFALNMGTSGAIRSISRGPTIDRDKDMRFFCYYIGYGNRLPGGAVNNAGIGLRWFRDGFGHLEVAMAKLLDGDPYDLLTRQAESVEATSERLLILPFFSGERFPLRDPNAKCVMFGLTLRHGRGHVIRALMEGCVYTLRWILDAVVENGIKGEVIRVGGGGARSRLWRQILADILGIRVERTSMEEGTLVGAAVMGTVAMGTYRDIEEATKNMVNVVDVSYPNVENRERYERAYELFKKLYGSLKELFVEHLSLGP